MHIVERGDGFPQCWVTGMTVGHPHSAFRFDRSIEPETPYGPIYLSVPVVEQMAGMLGFVSPAEVEDLKKHVDDAEDAIADLEAQLTQAKVDVEQFRHMVEKFYTPAVELHSASPELKIGQGKPGPGRPKKVLA